MSGRLMSSRLGSRLMSSRLGSRLMSSRLGSRLTSHRFRGCRRLMRGRVRFLCCWLGCCSWLVSGRFRFHCCSGFLQTKIYVNQENHIKSKYMTKQQLIQLKRSYRSYCESDDNQEEQRKQFHFTID